jgi:hypothetical protein
VDDLALSGAVLFVKDLNRSLDFYRQLLGLEVVDTSATAAMLSSPAGTHLVLRAAGPQAAHPLGGLGVQYIVWKLQSRADLDKCEQLLRQWSAFRETRSYAGITSVEGHDPDNLVVMLTYSEPGAPALQEIPARVYAWL